MIERRGDVLVTGASAGIGLETALAFARTGARVLATGRRAVPPDAIAHAGDIVYLSGDLTDAAFVGRLAEQAREADTLIACAGALNHCPFLESDPRDWQSVFDVNVVGTMRLVREVAANMVRHGGGTIILLTSTLVHDGPLDFTAVYSATKAALRSFADGLRKELGREPIRICEIAPGYTKTEIRRSISHPGVISAHARTDPPALTAAEVADAILTAVRTPSVELMVLRPRGRPPAHEATNV